MPLYRWDEIALEKVTEMVSRKVVRGERETLTQVYLKKGALVPLHAHDEEQMTYVLQGALQFLVGGEDVRVEEGEVLHIPSGVAHQAVALDDTFVLGVFSPARYEAIRYSEFRAPPASRRRERRATRGLSTERRIPNSECESGIPSSEL
jgi:quercetin dioxygenase-like cupin family protein